MKKHGRPTTAQKSGVLSRIFGLYSTAPPAAAEIELKSNFPVKLAFALEYNRDIQAKTLVLEQLGKAKTSQACQDILDSIGRTSTEQTTLQQHVACIQDIQKNFKTLESLRVADFRTAAEYDKPIKNIQKLLNDVIIHNPETREIKAESHLFPLIKASLRVQKQLTAQQQQLQQEESDDSYDSSFSVFGGHT